MSRATVKTTIEGLTVTYWSLRFVIEICVTRTVNTVQCEDNLSATVNSCVISVFAGSRNQSQTRRDLWCYRETCAWQQKNRWVIDVLGLFYFSVFLIHRESGAERGGAGLQPLQWVLYMS